MGYLTPTISPADENVDTSYEPFSREPEYIEANRLFIETLPLKPSMQILDMACGTGTMTDLILNQFQKGEVQWQGAAVAGATDDFPRVIGIDLSRESLRLGQQHLAGLGFLSLPNATEPSLKWQSANTVFLVEGTADCLPVADQSMDLAIIGNAIHMVQDQKQLFSEVARVLRPGGYFAFNTSFYAGTYVSGTEHGYLRWVQEALNYIRKRDAEMRAAGLPGVKRKRGQAGRAFSVPWLSIEDYTQAMASHGLITRQYSQRTVMLNQRCFETIGSYAGLAKVLLSGYPVTLACEALEKASGATLDAVQMTEVPRYWLEMVAQKAQD